AADSEAEAPAEDKKAAETKTEEVREDSGTVVGAMESSDSVVTDSMSDIGGKKVTPAVRALARKLKVDLATVEPSGKGGVVTRGDVEEAARNPKPAQAKQAAAKPAPQKPSRPRTPPSGEWEPIKGTRRTMARIMSESHAQVVATSLMDDADIHAWRHGQDITVRLLRSLWAGAKAEPGLNAWYDGEKNMRILHKGMDVGMAVDTEDGLFVAALRDVHSSDAHQMRQAINRLRDNVVARSIPPEDMKDYTIMLSNFGVFAGRYATPIIAPPCVCIVAAGKLRNEVVPVLGGFEVHRTIQLSLTFDQRAATGGEAARFLKAMLEDLALPE
ncbi:MAG: 2-oxo acid dehydrogenase subunit E2, partial [Xanthomonadales bacterium]|nr:2-oxo acid dehydrogenase subunit E2 [Xanthomonadales bacterium]